MTQPFIIPKVGRRTKSTKVLRQEPTADDMHDTDADEMVGRGKIVAVTDDGDFEVKFLGNCAWRGEPVSGTTTLNRDEVLLTTPKIGDEGRMVLRSVGMYLSYHLVA